MALLTKTSIYIGGKEVPSFKRLRLEQQIDAHHTLEVAFRMDTFEKNSSELGEKSKEFLGKPITIQIGSISTKSKQGKLEFKGVITEVEIVKGAKTGSGDEIIVRGKSLTILIDDGVHYNSFNEMRLGDVVDKTLKVYDKTLKDYKIDRTISPRYTELIDYCVQQNESCFNFISGLAAQYGEWFYYNGEKLIFGSPETEETELKYNVDLIAFNLNLAPQSQNFNYYTNDYLKSTIEENDKHSKPSGASAFTGFVYDKSEKIFQNKTTFWNNNNSSPKAKTQLKLKVTAQQDAIAIKQVVLTGASDNPGVRLGNIVKIEEEKYRVVDVVHSTNRNGQYQNNFKAISGGFDAYPKTDINAFPKSQSQIGIVKENADPDNMGRVKVQFPWQKKINKMTPWIRMVTMHAGSGKGFYYIPEKGEEVIVDFEGGNAETPYVSGCLYHSKEKPPEASSNQNNDIKIIQTKSGCSLTFNDEEGSITLMDKAGSSITMDGSGSISISAKSEVSINGPKEVSIVSADEVSLNGKKEVSIVSADEVSLNGGKEVSIVSNKEVFIKGTSEVSINSDVEAKMTGLAKATLSSSGVTAVEGTIIKLN